MLRAIWAFAFLAAVLLILLMPVYGKGRYHHRHHVHHIRPTEAPVFAPFWSTLQPHEATRVRHAAYHRRHVASSAMVVRHSRRARVAVVRDIANQGGGSSLVQVARAEVGNGPIYGRRNLWCARFVNYVLGRTGHKGTGSDLAWSFSRLPAVEMHVGAIAVMRHYVGIVSGVTRGGDPVLISGNNAGRVRETVYPRGRVAAFVSPQ